MLLSILTLLFIAYFYPTTVSLMNYNSVILVGTVFVITVWWFIHGRTKYPGPKLWSLYIDGRVVDIPNKGKTG